MAIALRNITLQGCEKIVGRVSSHVREPSEGLTDGPGDPSYDLITLRSAVLRQSLNRSVIILRLALTFHPSAVFRQRIRVYGKSLSGHFAKPSPTSGDELLLFGDVAAIK